MTDVESLYPAKFGDISMYRLMPPNPAFCGTVRLEPPRGDRFTETEWHEFLDYVGTSGRKIKAAFRDGQILIEEASMHGVREAGLNVFSAGVIIYNSNAVGPLGDDILIARGQSDYTVSRSCVMPDATWVPEHGVAPSIFFEIGNTQEVSNLIDKAALIMRHSANIRYFILVKVWRSPNPEETAMVIGVWRKTNNSATADEWLAIKFTSFGLRAPTDEELADFPTVAGSRPWVPALDGFIAGVGGVPCSMANANMPLYVLTLLPVHVFNVPSVATPPHLLALPDLTVHLYKVQREVMGGISLDIRGGLWSLTNAQLGQIVNSAACALRWASLHAYALQRYVAPPAI